MVLEHENENDAHFRVGRPKHENEAQLRVLRRIRGCQHENERRFRFRVQKRNPVRTERDNTKLKKAVSVSFSCDHKEWPKAVFYSDWKRVFPKLKMRPALALPTRF